MKSGAGRYHEIPIDLIRRRPNQPRKHFDQEKLRELGDSMLATGQAQPCVVRELTDSASYEKYELIAGERRWRAAGLAGIPTVDCVVRDYTPAERAAVAIAENVQREELAPLEVAQSYRDWLEEFGTEGSEASQAELGRIIGLSRAEVCNRLRLLDLPSRVKDLMNPNSRSEGWTPLSYAHGRALCHSSLSDAERIHLAVKASQNRWSSRKLLSVVTELVNPKKGAASDTSPEAATRSKHIQQEEQRVGEKIGNKVNLNHHGPGGYLVIHYTSLDEYEGIIEKMELGAEVQRSRG